MRTCVGIVTRGRAELAEKAVASALMQVPPPELVWVIEDGVVGKAFEWSGGGSVRITKLTKSKGYMAARQKMMMEAQADVYVSLDDDAWFLDPRAMVEAVRVMEGDPKIAAVGFEILSPDCPRSLGKKAIEQAKIFIGCGHALRLQAVRNVGGYDKMLGFYGGEEKDLCLRLIDRGWKVVKLVGVPVWHEKTSAQRDAARQRHAGVVNDLTFIFRRCPGARMWFYLAGNIWNQVSFSLKKPNQWLLPSLGGVFKFLSCVPSLVSTRQPVKIETWKKFRQAGA